ncbi:hypothetical protein GGS26DRAFT_577319 [Hypomontagnella submonticulosa]|nr:hypothetical protein GGS26DRAFT_577319 [Hypomontagnella submonticulosa]
MNTDNDIHPSPSFTKSDDGGVTIGTSKVQDLTDLSNDLFLLISSYLPPQDCILCRRVSRAWFAAFTSADVSWNFMRWHFPRSREMRRAVEELGPNPDWTRIFACVARRYYYLRAAKPRLIEKIDVVQETTALPRGPIKGVAPWNRILRWIDHTAPFQHRDPTWCVDDGLLVYQETVSERYVAYDLETRHRYSIPFDGAEKTVRRLRLTCGVLVIEWCERKSYHQLNDQETVHRHFATAFDVVRRRSSTITSAYESEIRFTWDITFRSEWKIHFLGLPLNNHDRFFSAHTATHYALYLWQPNRSPWGEEDPLEQLTIWDIAKPSEYKPSLDPTGANKPTTATTTTPHSLSNHNHDHGGPTVVNRFTWRDLEFLGLRQRHTPKLREILLDEANVYIHEEDHRWLAGRHSGLTPPRHHQVRCTGIPFHGTGPRWTDECCADGDVHMSFCPRAGALARLLSSEKDDGDEPNRCVGGHRNLWPGWAPCWRHEEFPYLTVSHAVDADAGVRVVARQCFVMEALSSFVLPKISVQEEEQKGEEDEVMEVRFADEMWGELLAKGKIAGDERWVVGEDGDGRVTVVRF